VLIGQDGKQRIVLKIEQEYVSGFVVHNLTISEDHTFAVGSDAVLVHNTTRCGEVIIESNAHAISPRVARELNKNFNTNLHPREWGRALEALKDFIGVPNDYHGKIGSLAGFYDKATKFLGDFSEFL
jgi:hypothetical protein